VRRARLAAVVLAGAMLPAVAHAQAAPVPVAAPDPARLAAARELVDVLMPPESRVQMIEGMIAPMIANLQQGMAQNPMFSSVMAENPEMKARFAAFVDGQQMRTLALMRDRLPSMVDAIARAYARRFDVAQSREIKAFFATPTGRLYMQQSLTILADPDVAAWQRSMMTSSMRTMQADAGEFARQVATHEEKKK